VSFSAHAVRRVDDTRQGGSDEVHAPDPSRQRPHSVRPGGLGTSLRGRAAGRVRRLPGAQRDAGVSPGLQLQPPETATTVRVENGATLTTDGPFVAIKEALGGYFVFEADDLDAAIAVASVVPAARMGGAVEVRPVVEY
jgi:hypothetical protein